MTVTWTSGYGINEAGAFVEWGPKGGDQVHSPAGTLTFDRNSMCGVLNSYVWIFFSLKTIWECCHSKHQDSPACIRGGGGNLSPELGQIMFRRLTHLQKNCMMVHFSFQYCWNITQNLFLGSFPLVHNSSYCCIWADAPARTVGWRDPGFIHTSFLKELWPNAVYVVSLFLHMILILGVNS